MRSRIPLRPSAGEQLLGRASRLKLDFMRCEDGEVWADFHVEGSLQSDDVGCADARDFIAFMGQLVGSFTAPRPDGEGGGV